MSPLPRVLPLPAIPLLTARPFAFTLSNLTAHFSSLTPLAHPVIPAQCLPRACRGAGTQQQQPLLAATCHPVHGCSPRSPNHRFPVHAEPVEPQPFAIRTRIRLGTRHRGQKHSPAASQRHPGVPGRDPAAQRHPRAEPVLNLSKGGDPAFISSVPAARHLPPTSACTPSARPSSSHTPGLKVPVQFRASWTGPNIAPKPARKAPPGASRVFWKKLLPRARPPLHHPQKPPARRHPTTPVAPLPPSPCGRGLEPAPDAIRSKRCPAAPAGASTPIRRRPTVPNPAHLAATTGDNRMADPLPRRTR